MKHFMLPMVIAVAVFSVACTSNEKPVQEVIAEETPADFQQHSPQFATVNPALSTQLNDLFVRYEDISKALGADDAANAASGAGALLKAMDNIDKTLMDVPQRQLYESVEIGLKEDALHTGRSAIEHQREHFEKMSEAVYTLAKAFGADRPLYKAYCPMAFDNKGASWISSTTTIRNPYFGEKMLTCGNVQEMIK